MGATRRKPRGPTTTLDLDAMRAGDPVQTEVFVRQYAPRIYHLAYRMCQDSELAKETAQEALSIAMQKIHQFRGESRLITWLYRILFNECLRSKREEARYRPFLDYHWTADAYRPPAPNLGWLREVENPQEQAALRREFQELLWQSIDRLPPNLRKVFLLRDIEGLSTQETARVLGLTESNVKVRLHRARRRLRELLAARLPHAGSDA